MNEKTRQTKPKKIKQGKWWKHQEQLAKEFKITPDDLHNLMDFFSMAMTPPEIGIDLPKTLKMNKMDKWFGEFEQRVEEVCLDETTENGETKKVGK